MTDAEWLSISYQVRQDICAYIFEKLADPEGGSFRKVIYDKLGFEGASYEPLYVAGGMIVTNAISLYNEAERMKDMK